MARFCGCGAATCLTKLLPLTGRGFPFLLLLVFIFSYCYYFWVQEIHAISWVLSAKLDWWYQGIRCNSLRMVTGQREYTGTEAHTEKPRHLLSLPPPSPEVSWTKVQGSELWCLYIKLRQFKPFQKTPKVLHHYLSSQFQESQQLNGGYNGTFNFLFSSTDHT